MTTRSTPAAWTTRPARGSPANGGQPRPSGRLAQHVFLSTDGTALLFYAQWTSDEEHLAWARAHRARVVSRVDTLVPGIERPGLARTRLAHSVVHDAKRPAGPGQR